MTVSVFGMFSSRGPATGPGAAPAPATAAEVVAAAEPGAADEPGAAGELGAPALVNGLVPAVPLVLAGVDQFRHQVHPL
jgi:hypothetical protein